MRYLLGTVIFFCIGLVLRGQQLLNGSFENHTYTECTYNIVNNVFNLNVPFVTAYGAQSEIDVLEASCNYGSPADGVYFIALYNNLTSDAIALDLSAPLLPDKLYKLSFAARLGLGISNNFSKVEVGLSNANDEFGTLEFVSANLDSVWQYFEVQFSPDVPTDYLQFRISSVDESWVYLDDITLECPTIDLGPDTSYCRVASILLEIDDRFEQYTWSDGTTTNRIFVDEPGIYSVLAEDGNCLITDTIVINEIAGNCNCELFIPNVFSPNKDGINDTFRPYPQCAIFDYQLMIFDRWGQLVFQSQDLSVAWPGTAKNKPVAAGTYLYTIQARFDYQEVPFIKSGSVTVVY